MSISFFKVTHCELFANKRETNNSRQCNSLDPRLNAAYLSCIFQFFSNLLFSSQADKIDKKTRLFNRFCVTAARLLEAEFPGLTDWKIKAARAQAFFQGNSRDVLPENTRNPVQRYTEKQLTHFVTFI